MQFYARLLLLMLAATAFAASAQEAVREQPPLYRGPVDQVSGVFVTPIAGVPFSGTVVIESRRLVADGTVEIRHSVTSIARDSSGRIRNERHMLVPESFHGTPPLVSVHIFDPATRLSNIWNPATLVCRQQTVPLPRQDVDFHNGSKTEDLGYTTLNGFQAKGTRVTRTVPAKYSGTGKQVEITDEIWYSEELHMNQLERHTDVRGGVQTVAISTIKRAQPAAELFEVPTGYKVVDMTPPPGAPAAADVNP